MVCRTEEAQVSQCGVRATRNRKTIEEESERREVQVVVRIKSDRSTDFVGDMRDKGEDLTEDQLRTRCERS